jgi:hypothetical protein
MSITPFLMSSFRSYAFHADYRPIAAMASEASLARSLGCIASSYYFFFFAGAAALCFACARALPATLFSAFVEAELASCFPASEESFLPVGIRASPGR